jgi:hypothetical protein
MLMLLVLLAWIPQSPVKPSQHGSITQQIAATTIAIEYDRPVARGRDLFGSLVPYGRVWCPGANDCTTIALSTDVKINDHAVPAGTYTLWAIPGDKKWTFIINRSHPTFHTRYQTVADQDLLRIEATPKAGPHVETLSFTFPLVDGRHAELHFQWGTVMVPLLIDVP